MGKTSSMAMLAMKWVNDENNGEHNMLMNREIYLLRYYCPPTKLAEDNISQLSAVALGSGVGWGQET